MAVAQRDQIAQNMQQKTTEELLDIWVNNDRDQWSDAAFEAISQTLVERKVSVPPQSVFVSTPRSKGAGVWPFVFGVGLALFSPCWVILATVSICGGIGLWQARAGASKKTKVVAWCVVALCAVGAYRTYGGVTMQTLIVCIPGVIGLVVWQVYLDSPKRVKATYVEQDGAVGG
jgi:hypothetical protein